MFKELVATRILKLNRNHQQPLEKKLLRNSEKLFYFVLILSVNGGVANKLITYQVFFIDGWRLM